MTDSCCGPFGPSNMHSALDFCPRPARKETNVPNTGEGKSLLSWYIYWDIIDVHKSTSRVNDYCYDDNSSLSCVLAKKQDLFSALYINIKWVLKFLKISKRGWQKIIFSSCYFSFEKLSQAEYLCYFKMFLRKDQKNLLNQAIYGPFLGR